MHIGTYESYDMHIDAFLWTQRAQRIHLRDDKPFDNSPVRKQGLRVFGSKDHSIGQHKKFKAVALPAAWD